MVVMVPSKLPQQELITLVVEEVEVEIIHLVHIEELMVVLELLFFVLIQQHTLEQHLVHQQSQQMEISQ